MFLVFEDRPSDSPVVERVWRCHRSRWRVSVGRGEISPDRSSTGLDRLYLVPSTSVLGALLLTGYLGGAIATHVRVGSPLHAFPDLRGPDALGRLV
jgi:DoxX-like family